MDRAVWFYCNRRWTTFIRRNCYSFKGDINELAGRVHPIFALVFITAIYLCLGVFVSVPRTGTVAYEMSVAPFYQVR